jgi:hypothetical protein
MSECSNRNVSQNVRVLFTHVHFRLKCSFAYTLFLKDKNKLLSNNFKKFGSCLRMVEYGSKRAEILNL